ncbi:MAG: amidohydrolase [Euryarchaeota archaeon TMED255]|nr:MAG: amidohydrolase [Euryarchaeota archaeon TMED255]
MGNTRNLIISGGHIVDGMGATPIRADLRIQGNQIKEIGNSLDRTDSTTIDASGCFVCPGIIESHTHFDGSMWWQPGLDPLPGCGVTTMIMGNCGFSLAPLSEDAAAREEVVKIFSFFEDFPEAPFFSELPWDWKTWSEYSDSMKQKTRVPLNYAAFVGHIALRLAVMGVEAWERSATSSEIEQMVVLLEDALKSGALGISTNLLDHDGEDRPIPSLMADDKEFLAIFECVSRFPGTTVQVVIDSIMRMTAVPAMDRIARLTEGLSVRVQWAGIPTLEWQKTYGLQQPLVELHERFVEEGRDFWTGYAHVPIVVTASIQQSLLFAQSNEYVWHEVVTSETDEEKRSLLNDAEWRARARYSWENDSLETSFFREPSGMMLDNSENDSDPIISLGDYAMNLGLHPSDALAEWFLKNGLSSTVSMPPWDQDDDMVIRLTRDGNAVGNINDSGAHGQMFCGSGDSIRLLTDYVCTGKLKIEEAIHSQTGKLAQHFGFSDRGEIKVGKRADVTVFALDEIEHRAKYKVYDVPDDKGSFTWRWTRDPAPVRLTLCNGVPTFDKDGVTGAMPGEMVSPS